MTLIRNALLDGQSISVEATSVHDARLIKATYETLHRHYPGHPWYIESHTREDAPDVGGCISIKLSYEPPFGISWMRRLALQHGFVLPFLSILGADAEREVMLAGGEMLERWGLSRKRASEYSMDDATSNGIILDKR